MLFFISIPALCRKRQGSIHKSVNITKVASDSPPLQPCTKKSKTNKLTSSHQVDLIESRWPHRIKCVYHIDM